VSEALAEGMTVIDYVPGSEVAADYRISLAGLRSFRTGRRLGPGDAGASDERWV